VASRGSSHRRRRFSPEKGSLEGLANIGMLRAVHGWISTRKGWDRTDKRLALDSLDEVRELIEENEREG
jgi:hypothetical protein